jgi:3-hydroxyisobutyrate dehydrogenase
VKAGAILRNDFTPDFSVALAAKDARLIVQAAETAGLYLDVASAAAERLRRAAELGHGEEDMAAAYFASFSGPATP